MAIRQKTVEYNFEQVNSILNNLTDNTSSVLMVSLPETGSRVFKSCWMETYMRDTNPAAASRGNTDGARTKMFFNGVESPYKHSLSSAAYNDTGEQIMVNLCDDYTSDFNTHFTGSNVSMSTVLWYSSSAGSSPQFTNIVRKLYITYDFNDTNATTRVKTVKIPMEYLTGSMLDNVHQASPNNSAPQIPALDTFCPESGKVFRNIWLEFSGVERDVLLYPSASYLSASLDNDTKNKIGFFEQALSSNIPFRVAWNLDSMNTSTTHSLWLSKTGSCNFINCSPILHATYDYNNTDSTRILNSVQSSFNFPGFYGFGFNATDVFAHTHKFIIPESNPTLKQSALVFHVSATSTGPTLFFNIGTGSVITSGFTVNIGGPWGLQAAVMRFDSQSLYYPLISSLPDFKTGLNNIRTSMRISSQAQRTCPPPVSMFLNYESDKHSDGSEVHNKTIKRLQISGSIAGSVAYIVVPPITGSSNDIPESDYFINYYGYQHVVLRPSVASRTIFSPIRPNSSVMDFVDTRYNGNFYESYVEDGYALATSVAEKLVNSCLIPDQSKTFRRYPTQLTSSSTPFIGSLNPEVTRSYVVNTDVNAKHSFSDVITYNSITFPVTGTVSGYTGDGSGIVVTLHDVANGTSLKSTITTIGGAYTMSWYNVSQSLYVESQQDSTHTGRSVNGSIV